MESFFSSSGMHQYYHLFGWYATSINSFLISFYTLGVVWRWWYTLFIKIQAKGLTLILVLVSSPWMPTLRIPISSLEKGTLPESWSKKSILSITN